MMFTRSPTEFPFYSLVAEILVLRNFALYLPVTRDCFCYTIVLFQYVTNHTRDEKLWNLELDPKQSEF